MQQVKNVPPQHKNDATVQHCESKGTLTWIFKIVKRPLTYKTTTMSARRKARGLNQIALFPVC